MDPLPPVPSCQEEEICAPLEEVPYGLQFAVTDPDTNCVKRLERLGTLAMVASNGSQVKEVDGSVGNEATLQNLQEIGSGFPKLMALTPANNFRKFSASTDSTKQVLTSISGGIQWEDFLPPACFEEDQVCECEPDWIAGFQRTAQEDGSYKWCLVRQSPSELPAPDPDYFASTSTVQVTGTGTQGDPYKFHVKLSIDEGNIMEIRSDGLFTECCLTYGDPLDAA